MKIVVNARYNVVRFRYRPNGLPNTSSFSSLFFPKFRRSTIERLWLGQKCVNEINFGCK